MKLNDLNLKDENQAPHLLTREFLIELLEGEVEPTLVEDVEVLLLNSIHDRRVLKSLTQTRELIKASDDVIATLMPEDGRVYDRLHASIMTAVANLDADKKEEGFSDVGFAIEIESPRLVPNHLKD